MTEILVENNQLEDISDVDKENEDDFEINKDSEGSVEPLLSKKEETPINNSPGAVLLRNWLNKTLRVEMSDGRILMGVFLCTDRDANIILGSCSEYLPGEEECNSSGTSEEPRVLGLVMVPGKHIVTICIDQIDTGSELIHEVSKCDLKSVNEESLSKPLTSNIDLSDVQ